MAVKTPTIDEIKSSIGDLALANMSNAIAIQRLIIVLESISKRGLLNEDEMKLLKEAEFNRDEAFSTSKTAFETSYGKPE